VSYNHLLIRCLILGTLEKLIPNFPRISKPAKKHQRKDGVFTSMTPLSILQGPKPTSKATKSPATTFEERLNKHKFDSETTIEFIFDDQNRRIQQVDDQRCSTGVGRITRNMKAS